MTTTVGTLETATNVPFSPAKNVIAVTIYQKNTAAATPAVHSTQAVVNVMTQEPAQNAFQATT